MASSALLAAAGLFGAESDLNFPAQSFIVSWIVEKFFLDVTSNVYIFFLESVVGGVAAYAAITAIANPAATIANRRGVD